MKPCISVVINTLNEEKNLGFALRSVAPWAGEIVVVDMHSQDHTVQVARQYGARVCLHDGPGFNYAPREFAVAQANYEWVFVLDADELVPLPLSEDLQRIVCAKETDVAMVPRTNFLLGAALKGTGWGPHQDYQARLFRKEKIRASSIAHQDFVPVEGARISRLAYDGRNAIVHFNYLDSAHFIQKLNQYTSIEALQGLERNRRSGCLKGLLYASKEFLSRYLKKGGYRDGWRGFYLACFMAFYRLATFAKLKELGTVGNAGSVETRYREVAEGVISGYQRTSREAASPKPTGAVASCGTLNGS